MSTDQKNAGADAPDADLEFIPTETNLTVADDGLPTARMNSWAGVIGDTAGSLVAETQDLRRRRLAAAALFLACLSAGLLAWALVTGKLWEHWGTGVIRGAQLLVAAAAAAVLLSQIPLSRRAVRGIEFALFGAFAISIGISQYLFGVEYLRQGDAVAMANYLKNGVIGTIILVLLYGALIPNDAVTAAKAILSMALVPVLAFTLLMELEHPDLIAELESMRSSEHAGSNVVALMAGASLAIYCAHILNGLRKDLHDARKFGQYHLGRRIGAGGMGEVFLAEHQLLKRPCALKLIKGDGGDPLALARFEREVKSAARLSHPNTIAIYDYGQTEDGTFYYVMEYLPGMSLQELVSQYGPVPAARLLYLMRQVCGGLAEAHALGIIHRDLKPANIFVAIRGGEADVAKILDFGLVKLTADPEAPELTTDRSVSGTPAFMSPEQATGDRPVDPRTDVYALGAIAYYALTGRPPFDGATAMAVMIAQVRDPVVPPSQIRDDVPEDLERVILRCLAKDPDDRYPNVKALARDLAACAAAREWDEEKADAWWNDLVEPVAAPAPV
ncbi:serine/threonine-protein kinase [Paludisphaera soli]|uniref:serine/threonine-protein kinase n=1 Tax=Paludisphaera soli TaxID=2712865 RepID=UPI0013EE341C|nr:serine/threonine-protein kinase [Paludisphaera soli]